MHSLLLILISKSVLKTTKLAEKKIKKEDLRTILFVSRLLGMMQY
jgi:hypothetical protein